MVDALAHRSARATVLASARLRALLQAALQSDSARARSRMAVHNHCCASPSLRGSCGGRTADGDGAAGDGVAGAAAVPTPSWAAASPLVLGVARLTRSAGVHRSTADRVVLKIVMGRDYFCAASIGVMVALRFAEGPAPAATPARVFAPAVALGQLQKEAEACSASQPANIIRR